MALTALGIEKHKFTKPDEFRKAGNNLYMRFRISPKGKKTRSWLFRYRLDSKLFSIPLGEYDATLPESLASIYKLPTGAKMTLSNAKRVAVEMNDWRKQGLDPRQHLEEQINRIKRDAELKAQEEHLQMKARKVEVLTVKDLFQAWIVDGVRRKDGNLELHRSFNADILPKIGETQIKELEENDLRRVLLDMVERGVSRSAIVARNNLAQMFSWAEKRQPWRRLMVEGNPMDLIEIRKILPAGYSMNSMRQRVLSDVEIRELHKCFNKMLSDYDAAIDKRGTAQPFAQTSQLAIWIMLSTLSRVGETHKARWENVNFEKREWFIPKADVKDNIADITVYLSDFALAQFKLLKRITGHSEWCFPSRHREGHVCVKSLSKQIGDRQSMFKKGLDGQPRKPMRNRRHDNTLVLKQGESGSWTAHDLRRTGATLMQRLGISLDIIDRCQNHVLAGSKIRRHYLHHGYADEMRDAWQKLGSHLTRLLAFPENVIPLRRKA